MRARSGIFFGALAIGAAFTLSACTSASDLIPQSTGEPSVTGTWKSDDAGEPHLTLGDDLTVTGSDGCNGISTTYTIDGDIIEFKSFFSTLKGCQGIDTWLSAVSTASVNGDTMTVLNRAGGEIGVLHRAS